MQQYKDYLADILANGEERDDRTGTGTLSVFGREMRFNLKEGFPLVTIKEVPLRVVFEELMWFLRGQTNLRPLLLKKVNIWNKDAYRHYCGRVESPLSFADYIQRVKDDEAFADEYGDLGPIYGAQWRSWQGNDGPIDQITNTIRQLKEDPHGRRHIVSALNIGEMSRMGLPPCHYGFQLYRDSKGLSCKVTMRSSDGFLGATFNIASYALLMHFIALELGIEVNELILSVGDAHIYKNHIEQVKLILEREPKPLPQLLIYKMDSLFDYEWEDIALIGYDPHPAVKGEMST